MRKVIIGLTLSAIGPLFWLWPAIFNPTWDYYNPGWGFALSIVGLGAIIVSGYLLGRGLGTKGVVTSVIPAIIFVGSEVFVIASSGYQGTGGGAVALFLLPIFILVVSLVSAEVGVIVKSRANRHGSS